jgi:hypothetical protein
MTTKTKSRVSKTSVDIVKTMRKAGINIQSYKRSPTSGSEFVIAGNGLSTKLYLWATDKVVAEVYPDRQQKQAVLYIEEPARKVNLGPRVYYTELKFSEETTAKDLAKTLEKVTRKHVTRTAQSLFPGTNFTVDFNNSSTILSFETQANRLIKGPKSKNTYQRVRIEYSCTANLEATKLTLLVGVDETAHFICALPKKVKSVKAAHEALRPKGVPRNALRQGEWFFVPVTKKERKAIEEHILKDPYRVGRGSLESFSSHEASAIVFLDRNKKNEVRYVNISVYDARPNRHKAILLNDWHKIVRNNEISVPNTAQRNTRYWD